MSHPLLVSFHTRRAHSSRALVLGLYVDWSPEFMAGLNRRRINRPNIVALGAAPYSLRGHI